VDLKANCRLLTKRLKDYNYFNKASCREKVI